MSANVAHATAARDAEIEALRAEVERLTERAQHAEDVAASEHFRHERLAEAVLGWWKEHEHDTVGYRGEYNVYDEPPEFVCLALPAAAQEKNNA